MTTTFLVALLFGMIALYSVKVLDERNSNDLWIVPAVVCTFVYLGAFVTWVVALIELVTKCSV